MAAVATRPIHLDKWMPSPPRSDGYGEASQQGGLKAASFGKGNTLEELLKDEVKFEVMRGGLGSGGFEKYEKQLLTPVCAPVKKNPSAPATALASARAAPSSITETSATTKSSSSTTLFDGVLNQSWPAEARFKSPGRGLRNVGNTCFLNSIMQVMLHTPGLIRLALNHFKADCPQAHKWCMLCSYAAMIDFSFGNKKTTNMAYGPSVITSNLNKIAKHLRIGRQEDAQEFFRFATDAFQASALAGRGKLPMSMQETTWVYALWGGKYLSRVTCLQCNGHSDKYDSYLDLSVDVGGVGSIKDALEKLVAVDHLKGANKYKCEKCKKHVNAEKRFLLAEVPPVLTIHLKRFKPGGGKISRMIQYPPTLDISKYMVTKQSGVTYDLFGVTCHSGGGPHSGHYYSYIKAGDGFWYEANDSDVSKRSVSTVMSQQGAYLLSYVRSKGSALANAISAPPMQRTPNVNKPFIRENASASSSKASPVPLSPIARPSHPSPGAVQKRKRESSEEEEEGIEESEHYQVHPVRSKSESPKKRRKDKRPHDQRASLGAVPPGDFYNNSHQKHQKEGGGGGKHRREKTPNPFGFVSKKGKGMVGRMQRR